MSTESDDDEGYEGPREVWIHGADSAVEGEQFIEAMGTVEDIQDTLERLQEDLADMDTGLDKEDTISLLKGRNPQTARSDFEAFFEAIETVVESEPSDIAPRLIQSKVSGLTIEEAAETFDELVELAEKYGELADYNEDDGQ